MGMIDFSLGEIGGVFTSIREAITGEKIKDPEAKLELLKEIHQAESKMMEAQAKTIVAEAQSEHFLVANWRPITMLVFVGLIAAHWMGWTAPGLTDTSLTLIFSTVQIGLGGYIGARTVDKGIDKLSAAWKERKNG